MGARYYQPNWGRFTQPDPLPKMLITINRYAYANCNPANYIDPTGLDARSCVDAVILGTGALALTAAAIWTTPMPVVSLTSAVAAQTAIFGAACETAECFQLGGTMSSPPTWVRALAWLVVYMAALWLPIRMEEYADGAGLSVHPLQPVISWLVMLLTSGLLAWGTCNLRQRHWWFYTVWASTLIVLALYLLIVGREQQRSFVAAWFAAGVLVCVTFFAQRLTRDHTVSGGNERRNQL